MTGKKDKRIGDADDVYGRLLRLELEIVMLRRIVYGAVGAVLLGVINAVISILTRSTP